MKTTIISIIFLLFVGCVYNTGTVQRAEKSFLQFIGNSEGVRILIDENNTFELAETKENKDMLYQLSHGKHTLKIYRNNNLIIDRIIFLEDHGTMEIIIPWKTQQYIYCLFC